MVLLPGVRHARLILTKFRKELFVCSVYFADWHEQAIPLLIEANVLPIIFLYYESVSALIQDINNDKAPAIMC